MGDGGYRRHGSFTPQMWRLIRNMSYSTMDKFMQNLYESAFHAGEESMAKEICDDHGACQVVYAEWIEEHLGSEVLGKLMEGVENESKR